MATISKIEWTEKTWNPIAGCTPVSPGCLNCYAATMARRLEAMGQPKYANTVTVRNGLPVFNGTINFGTEDELTAPLHWKRPSMIFVNSMSDLFHEAVPFDYIDKVFAVMALCPQHTFQILTKRPERAAEYFDPSRQEGGIGRDVYAEGESQSIWEKRTGEDPSLHFPLPNVWLGTSVENQKCADERIPHLLRCPAAVRWLSVEPMLGPVDFVSSIAEAASEEEWEEAHSWGGECELCGGSGVREYDDAPDEWGEDCPSEPNHLITCRGCVELAIDKRCWIARRAGLHWVIGGDESGPHARGNDPKHYRSLRNQCGRSGIAYFQKQLCCNGRKIPYEQWPEDLKVRQWPKQAATA